MSILPPWYLPPPPACIGNDIYYIRNFSVLTRGHKGGWHHETATRHHRLIMQRRFRLVVVTTAATALVFIVAGSSHCLRWSVVPIFASIGMRCTRKNRSFLLYPRFVLTSKFRRSFEKTRVSDRSHHTKETNFLYYTTL